MMGSGCVREFASAPLPCRARLAAFVARAFAAMLVLAMMTGGLAGCVGASAEEVISGTLTTELDKVKNLDGSFVANVASYMDADRFSDYGIDSAAFVTAYFDGFDYSIDSIDVDEDAARAQVTLTCKSYSDFRTRLNDASDAMVDNADDYVSLSREDIARVYGDLLMETLNQVSLAATKPLVFTFTKTNDTWQMQENLESTIASSLLTN